MQNMINDQQNSGNQKFHKPDFSNSIQISGVSNNQNFDDNEVNSITCIVMCLYHESQEPLSRSIIKKLKGKYGGEWVVLVSNKDKNVKCSISSVKSNDFLTFCIGSSKFQIYRLK